MAEIKNTFIKAKMNKDLDDRLIPKGEYRDALNIGISQTEGSDVGALQVVLGNLKLADIELEGANLDCNVKVIGVHTDNVNQKLYLFLTNYLDTTSVLNNEAFSGEQSSTGILSAIVEFNTLDDSYNVLSKGSFLNFSLNSPILNVDIIEDLLFWTDDRNQPRKINITKARQDSSFYNNEDLISVAKYYPWQPIQLIEQQVTSITILSGGGGTPGTPLSPPFVVNEIYNTINGSGVGLTLRVTSVSGVSGNITGVEVVNPGVGYVDQDAVTIEAKVGTAVFRLNMDTVSTMKDTCTPYLPPSAGARSTSVGGTGVVLTQNRTTDPIALFEELTGGVYPTVFPGNDELWAYNPAVPSTGWQAVSELDVVGNIYQFDTVNPILDLGWGNNEPYYFAAKNPYYDIAWPGDCEYLKDKFVRFAYRFKYIDNEYSIISPFTQPIFQPQQYGYFTFPQEDEAVDSTEIEIAQNRITEVDLIIPCPDILSTSVSQTWSNVNRAMGIDSVEIIYKDDNESTLKVLTEIPADTFLNNTTPSLRYTYQSTAPFRVLPESELTRISDVVPIKAVTQSVSGNRVIYGNFLDKHSSIKAINYEVGTAEKNDNSKKQYYNHTVKQNRTYQVGFVLSDRYGRKSDVILSTQDFETTLASNNVTYGSSTTYCPYGAEIFNPSPADTWAGNQLSILLNQPIPDTGPLGYPGIFKGYTRAINSITSLYAGDGTETPTTVPTIYNTTGGSGTGLQVQGTVNDNGYFNEYMIIVDPGVEYEDGDIITIVGDASPPTATFIYRPNTQPNLLGFNSYQIVVKQQEQEYYNVYLPGIVNGEINTSTTAGSLNKAVISLFSDNINKVPKDLLEVGPSQTNYNSSAQLYLRVENTAIGNKQFNTDKTTQKVNQISELSDLGVNLTRHQSEISAGATTTWDLTTFDEDKVFPGSSVVVTDSSTGLVAIDLTDDVYVIAYYAAGAGAQVVLNQDISLLFPAIAPGDTFTFGPPGVIYNGQNNPLIGILSTSEGLGVSEDNGFKPFLAVVETTPVKSNLDIYYETTTVGNIQNANFNVRNSDPFPRVSDLSPILFELNETDTNSVTATQATNFFFPITQINTPVLNVNTQCTLLSVIDGNGNASSGWFIDTDNAGSFVIKSSIPRYCGSDVNAYTYIFELRVDAEGETVFKQFNARLSNSEPQGVPSSPYPFPRVFEANTRTTTHTSFVANAYNGAETGPDGGLEFEEVTKKLISATIVNFTNSSGCPDLPACPDCENPSATQWDYAEPTNAPGIPAGLFVGMNCKSWFMWEDNAPPNYTNFWNSQGTSNYNQYTCEDLPESSTPNSNLLCLGVPINNSYISTLGPLSTQPGPFSLTSTADRCDNIEISLVVEVCDGTGVCKQSAGIFKLERNE